MNSTMSSSMSSGVIKPIADDFNVTNEVQLVLPISCFLMGYVIGPILCGPLSEHYGRKRPIVGTFVLFIIFNMACAVAPNWPSLLIFRFLTGIVASGPIAIVPGLYADVYSDTRARGVAMACFMCATSCGPLLAPPISGFIGETVSWRWAFAFSVFFALATLPGLAFMPESYLPVLLARKAKKLRNESGRSDIIASTDLQKKSLKYILTVVMSRPYRMLVQESIVACVSLYASLTYAIFYLYFEGLHSPFASHLIHCLTKYSIPHRLSRTRFRVSFLGRTRRSHLHANRYRLTYLRANLPLLGLFPRQSAEEERSLGRERRVSTAPSRLHWGTDVCCCYILAWLVRSI